MATLGDCKGGNAKWAKAEERRERKMKKKWVGCNDPGQCFANKELNAENERLRAALERCREWFLYDGDGRNRKPVDMAQMCAEALEGKP